MIKNGLFDVAVLFLVLSGWGTNALAADTVPQWAKFEHGFKSERDYNNVLYDLKKFSVRFVSPTGRVKDINGFWDGGNNWKIRFSPDEKGNWNWQSMCSDSTNKGLNGLKGEFICVPGNLSQGMDL